MEYFDFEEASYASNNVQDDVASDCQEVDEAEAVENYESLFYDKNFQLHADSGLTADHVDDLHDQGPDPQPRADTPVVPEPAPGSQYPMFRSPLPCDFCRQMGFDCFLIQRGVLNNGCTCCVSLWRECSFTHAKAPGKYLHTLHPVGEDDVTSTGGLTGRRALKSVGSSKFDHLESRGRKSGARFSRDAVRILKNWLSEHYQHPYPNEAEKDALKERTGLRRSQIANWLANARRRGKVLPSARSSSPTPGAIDIPGSTHTSSTSSTTSTSSSSTLEYALMTPLERWKHSPPEHEAASIRNIIRAMANASPPPPSPSHAQHQHQQQNHYAPPTVSGHGRSLSRKTGSSNDSSSLFQAPSVSSYDTENKSSISDYSFASAFSHRSSQHSFNSADRKERRRRRKQMPPVPAFERQTVRGARIFQCTFCTDSFPAKYDWQRHEKSVHLALEKWTCAPRGGVITTIDGKKACAFCRAPNPTEDHLETHNYLACQEKTVQERTFYRKDHLNQHLRLMHDVKYDSSMDQWRSTTNEIKSRCGLCDTNFTTWKDRVDHIAQHFKNGADMSQWEGDWGFEPYVQRLVGNGIAPYLIASERASSSQDRAPRTSHSKKVASSFAGSQPLSLPVPADETSFARLENELKAFIGGQLFDGETPTDKQIQDQARMIVYGCDDPWNQTCADNVVWLSVLKRDCGMEDLPGLDNITLEDLGMQPPFAGRMQHPPLETNNLVAGNVRHSWFSNASLGSAAVSASGLQSPAFISSNGFHSAAHSMHGSLAGSFSGSIGVSSAGPSSIIPGLSSGWSSNFSVGEQSSSDWAGSAAFVDPMAQSNFDLELLQQLNDSESQGMDIDASIFDMEGLTSQDEVMPAIASAAAKNPQSLDPVTTAVMTTSETQPISIPTTTAAGNSADMHSYLDPLFSSQPGYT